jgi:DNA-binding beta-propeller fold protein YncE
MNRRQFGHLAAAAAASPWLPACVEGADEPVIPAPAGGQGALVSGEATRAFAPGGQSFQLAPLRNYVDVLDPSGRPIARIGSADRVPTSAVGDVSGPVAAAWDAASNRVLVLERGNARVQAFDSFGGSLGVVAAVDPSSDLAVDDRDGTIYVAVSSTHRIQVFTAAGAAAGTIGRFGIDRPGLNGPVSVAVGPDGTLHVVDAGSASVKVFKTDGAFVGSYGAAGDARLVGPRAIRFDAAGRAWVADTLGAAVQVYDARGTLLSRVSPRLADGRLAAPVALGLRADRAMYAAVIAGA